MQLSLDSMTALVCTLSALPTMQSPSDRRSHLSQVADEIGLDLAISWTGDAAVDIERMIVECASHWGGMWALLDSAALSLAEPELQLFLDQVAPHVPAPVLDAYERAQLVGILDDRPDTIDHLRAAYRLATNSTSTPVHRSAAEFAQDLEEAGSDGGGPRLLVFASELARETDDEGLAAWHATVADRRAASAPGHGRRRVVEPTKGTLTQFGGHERMPTVFEGVPPRNVHFSGREQALERLRRSLNQRTSASFPWALYGLGGVGKTQLATEYCYRYQADYDLIWWVAAEQETQLRASIAALASHLQIPEVEDQSRTVAAVLDALRRGHPFRRWLIVFDNAAGPEDLQSYFRYGAAGHFVITSRSRSWATAEAARAVEVGVLSRPESVNLVRTRNTAATDADANRLSERLGDLPIALEQAVSYQLAAGVSVDGYLRLLDNDPTRVLADGMARGTKASVHATFCVAHDRLRERSPAAAQLLELTAFFAAEPVSRTVLMAARHVNLPDPLAAAVSDDLRLIRTMREVAQLSLVRLDPRRGTMQLHRLLREVVQLTVGPEQRRSYRHWVSSILGHFNPRNPDDHRNWPAFAEMSAHVSAAGCVDGETELVRAVVVDQIRYLYVIGDYAGSLDLAAPALAKWLNQLGPNSDETLTLAFHLGNTLRSLAHYDQSRRLTEETWQRLMRTHGPQSPLTSMAANSYGADLRVAGRFRDAYNLDRRNVRVTIAHLGDGFNAARPAHNLAVDLRLLGQFGAAQAQNQITLASRRRALGDDHPETYHAAAELAFGVSCLGDYAEAVAMFEDLLPAFEATVGPKHSKVLRAGRLYASALRMAGRSDESRTRLTQLLQVYRASYGDNDLETIAAIATLAITLLSIGENAAALRQCETVAAAYRRILGARHPFTLASQACLALALRRAGGKEEAAALADRAYGSLRDALGDHHHFTLAARAAQAAERFFSHDIDASARLSAEVHHGYLELLGPHHPTTLEAAANLAVDLAANGDDDGAQTAMTGALDGLTRVLGHHPSTHAAQNWQRIDLYIEIPPL